MTDEILIEPQSTSDLTPEEVEELRQLIESELGVQARHAVREVAPGTAGVTWWEVVHLYVPWDELAKGAGAALVALMYRWVRSRFKNKPGRPRYVAIRGPDGRLLKSIAQDVHADEPVDQTEQDLESEWHRHRPPPS
jgi:hypothetical protein